MTDCFADTSYWVAVLNPRDQFHRRARGMGAYLLGRRLVTTDAVLVELLAHFSGYPPDVRLRAARFVRDTLDHPFVEVIPQDRSSFLAALALYEARPDKGYSLTDCLSMHLMRTRGIAECLTHDVHFAQEGFAVLLR